MVARLEMVLVLLLCVITWMLSHGYMGIFHDAGLYTLQALARLNPTSLGQDVFLHFGSQDRFTLFSPLYAAASRLIGVDTAAAVLTFTFQVGLLLGAWLLARSVVPARMALYGVAVLIAIPGDYGTDRIFTSIEQFLTPRMAAEALALVGLAAALRARTWLGLALLGLAALLHPIMAAAGLAALLFIRPRAALVGMAALATAAFAMAHAVWGRFDPAWLHLVMDRSPYLFIRNWRLDDWARVAVTAATLTAGLAALSNGARKLCGAALLTMLGGLALTFIACDGLNLILFTQLQPWRWQWLGTVSAALLLPTILGLYWRAGVCGRTTALLLAAAWVFSSNGFAVVAAAAALGSLAWTTRLKPGEARLVFWGACGMLAIAITWRFASNLEFMEMHYLDPGIVRWIRRLISFVHDGSVPMAILLLVGWLARTSRAGIILPASIAALALVGAALLPQTWSTWTHREFPPQRIAQFAAWRDLIPPGSEVFWPEAPLDAWLLLDRPSYLSVLQTSGLVFSRDSAIELQRRAYALGPAIAPQTFLGWGSGGTNLQLSLAQLRGVCQLGAFAYLVTTADLGVAPVAELARDASPASHPQRLYRCSPPAG
ncbi:MAG: hypothetical protein ABJC66_10085 [Gammaproteobacteria bacterium]